MAWIESHTILIRHRKVLELAKALRLRPSHLIGHLHALWHAALDQQEDGNLAQWSDQLIADLSDYPGDAPQYVRLLQEHGWLAGKLLHDWLDYAGPYLIRKYHTSNRQKLESIWLLYGKKYGSKYLGSEQSVKRKSTGPNLTGPNQQTTKDICSFFEDVWTKYPKRIGKKQAKRHFLASVRSEVDVRNVEIALTNYLASDTVKKGYIQNASTWFNNWQDWLHYIRPEEGPNRETKGMAAYQPGKYSKEPSLSK